MLAPPHIPLHYKVRTGVGARWVFGERQRMGDLELGDGVLGVEGGFGDGGVVSVEGVVSAGAQ